MQGRYLNYLYTTTKFFKIQSTLTILIDSIVCSLTPSSAATTNTTISVTCAPRLLIVAKAACPGVAYMLCNSTKFRFSYGCIPKTSFKWSSDDFLFVLGFDVKLDLNPHFLTISRRTETLSIKLVVAFDNSDTLIFFQISIVLFCFGFKLITGLLFFLNVFDEYILALNSSL
ncbi:hypothetical protein AGLY_007179 [Aphis glycines]|uniref:Uncharacterized protein n=1 Tax=Aphis glycines TaxID=307491 RepID=A0A6G0TR48_APHGL|nr:hypothetical protein AGLY_007179 [Aphis glycines]